MGNHEVQNACVKGYVSIVPENQQRRRPRNETGAMVQWLERPHCSR